MINSERTNGMSKSKSVRKDGLKNKGKQTKEIVLKTPHFKTVELEKHNLLSFERQRLVFMIT